MAESKELVKLIRYEFRFTDLWSKLSDFELELYKIPESVKEYSNLCAKTLENIYPQAALEILSHADITINNSKSDDTSMSMMEIYVESLIDFEVLPDPDEIDAVASVCDRVFNEQLDDWMIPKDFRPIIQAKSHTQIPMSVIRWLCSQELIEATIRVTDRWLVLADDFSKIKSLVAFAHNPIQLNAFWDKNDVIACYLEDMPDVLLLNIPENVKLLIASKQGLDPMLFTADNTLCELRRVENKVELKIEHFIDTTGWSGWKWSYQEWTTALEEQARQKDIVCEVQFVERNEQQEASGIAFVMSLNVVDEMILQMLIQEGLGRLSSIIDDTDLALKGGPLWDDEADKIYQKNEDAFCQEVLLKLLRQMKFENVRYIHGGDEFGRDFIFKEETSFFKTRYYGLQAKAGNISGEAGSLIDKILSQIEDAFSMAYEEPGSPDVYIDTMIIATSGRFARNAIKKIRRKTPDHLVGSLYFWDKKTIQSLVAHYWRKEND